MQPIGPQDADSFLQQLHQMRDQLVETSTVLDETEFTGVAEAGLVTISLTAAGRMTRIHLDPAAVTQGDLARLERLIVAAHHDATERIEEFTREIMAPLNSFVDNLTGEPE